MRDYLFYGAGMQPSRMRFLVVPARRVLRRLLRPMFVRQVEIYEGFAADIEDLRSRTEDLRKEIAEVNEKVESIAALGWDHVALTRRLAAIEDRLAMADNNGHGEPSFRTAPASADTGAPGES